MPGQFQPIPNLKVVKATGIFRGVQQAQVSQRTRGDGGAATGRTLRLALDSWESPIDFEVTGEPSAQGATVYVGTAPRADGSTEQIAIRAEEHASDSSDAGVWRIDVTASTEGAAPHSVLELRSGVSRA